MLYIYLIYVGNKNGYSFIIKSGKNVLIQYTFILLKLLSLDIYKRSRKYKIKKYERYGTN